jgi:murein DD-endopeptidase MepM/ murein hydrolase activator NlpD
MLRKTMMRKRKYTLMATLGLLPLLALCLAAPDMALARDAAKPIKKSARKAQTDTRARLLQSAGRDAAKAQPEAGFTLAVPAVVGDGEAFLLEFGAEGVQDVRVSWLNKNRDLGVCGGGANACRLLLPVPLDEKAKHLPLALSVTWADGRQERFSADLPIKKRKYPVQKLKVAQKFVSPPPEMAEKIKRDRAELRAAVSGFSPVRSISLPFKRPVPGEVTSLYGMRRVFNNVPKNPHKGVDFDAKEGDPVAALDEGVVVLAANHYYSGNIVIVDHGLGVYSSYLHLSAIKVVKGQKIGRGDIIGAIGSTGRVTGPHLHLSLYVQGVSVNAAPLIKM